MLRHGPRRESRRKLIVCLSPIGQPRENLDQCADRARYPGDQPPRTAPVRQPESSGRRRSGSASRGTGGRSDQPGTLACTSDGHAVFITACRNLRAGAEFSARVLNSARARGEEPPVTPRTPAHSRNHLFSLELPVVCRKAAVLNDAETSRRAPPPRKRLCKVLFLLTFQTPLLKHPPRYQEDYNQPRS